MNPISPIVYATIMPTTIASPICNRELVCFWVMIPTIHAQIAKPGKYPPVGPRSTIGPAFPPAKTGNPNVPSNIQITTLSAPIFGPRTAPVNTMKKTCSVTGTGPIGRMMIELTQISAAKSETNIFRRKDTG